MKKETIRARKSSWKVRDCQIKTNFSKRLKKKKNLLECKVKKRWKMREKSRNIGINPER